MSNVTFGLHLLGLRPQCRQRGVDVDELVFDSQ
jgi:hypothetical protein